MSMHPGLPDHQLAGELARLLRVLGHAERLHILCRLTQGEKGVGELLAESPLSPSALSQHLARLRSERLVSCYKQGQNVFYQLTDPRVTALVHYLAALYCPHKNRDS